MNPADIVETIPVLVRAITRIREWREGRTVRSTIRLLKSHRSACIELLRVWKSIDARDNDDLWGQGRNCGPYDRWVYDAFRQYAHAATEIRVILSDQANKDGRERLQKLYKELGAKVVASPTCELTIQGLSEKVLIVAVEDSHTTYRGFVTRSVPLIRTIRKSYDDSFSVLQAGAETKGKSI